MATLDPLAIALQFIDGCRDNDWETARAAMHDDMVHVSPTDQIEGADKFIAYYRENFGGNGWTYELIDTICEGDRVAVRYRSIIPGMYDAEMVEWFAVKDGKITRADNYLAKIPVPPEPKR